MDLILSFPDPIDPEAVRSEVEELLAIGESFPSIPDLRWDDGEPVIDPAWLTLPPGGSQRQDVLLAVLEGGKCRDDLDRELGIGSVGPRLRELRLGGWIAYSDKVKLTQYGREGRVLEPTHKARTTCRLAPLAWFPGNVRPDTCR